jgi:hypothetical protein
MWPILTGIMTGYRRVVLILIMPGAVVDDPDGFLMCSFLMAFGGGR